jgi:alcohol dehydrogenase class IV
MSRDGQSELDNTGSEVQLSSFQAATHIFFGPGAVGKAGEIVQKLGIARALVVTDAGVLRAGIAGHVLNALSAGNVNGVVFDAVERNPGIETVQRAAALYRARGCTGIVAVGGGSVIDVAKGAGVLASNPGELRSYIGVGKIGEALPPLVAIPTTVGSGSEVTNFMLITDRAQRKKILVGSQLLAPDFALLDPGLALTLPKDVLAGTAMGALANAVESLTSVFASPFSDGLALQALRLIAANLEAALASPALGPRADLLYASTLAGLALSSARLGLAQAMAHGLAAYHDTPVGLSTAILLPHVMAYNLPAAERALALVAAALRARPSSAVSEPSDLSEGSAATGAPDAVRRLAAKAGLPDSLGALGVDESFIEQMAADVAETGSAQVVNPRRPAVEDLVALYRAAL